MFVLRRLEESYGASEPVDFQRVKLTIEHVHQPGYSYGNEFDVGLEVVLDRMPLGC